MHNDSSPNPVVRPKTEHTPAQIAAMLRELGNLVVLLAEIDLVGASPDQELALSALVLEVAQAHRRAVRFFPEAPL
jgi:hypothetical protein